MSEMSGDMGRKIRALKYHRYVAGLLYGVGDRSNIVSSYRVLVQVGSHFAFSIRVSCGLHG